MLLRQKESGYLYVWQKLHASGVGRTRMGDLDCQQVGKPTLHEENYFTGNIDEAMTCLVGTLSNSG